MSPSDKEYWESVAEQWISSQPDSLWRRHSDAVNSSLLRRWLPAGGVQQLLKTDLFDEAVSEGLHKPLADCASRLVGIDVSPEIVRAALCRFPDLDARTADVRKLPFEEASFDVVVSTSTLDHFDSLQEIQTALSELSRVLRPGGQLLLTLDNLSNPAVWLRSILPDRWLRSLGLIPYRVGTTCRPRQLKLMVREVGFEITAATAILHCPRALAVAATHLIERRASAPTQERFLKAMRSFERLEGWPTRYVTGYFTAIHARKPDA